MQKNIKKIRKYKTYSKRRVGETLAAP